MGLLIWTKDRAERANAARTSAAGDGWMPPNRICAPKEQKYKQIWLTAYGSHGTPGYLSGIAYDF